MITIRRCGILSALLALLAVAAAAAPATDEGGRTGDAIQVAAMSDGTYQIDERIYTPDQLRKVLRARGATKTTLIEVTIAADTTRNTIVAIGRDFAGAGYSMVVFVRPRKVDAYVGPAGKPSATNPPPAAVQPQKAGKRK